ncbi:hypothetical protein KI387_023118, partial [Taxus chinensis]
MADTLAPTLAKAWEMYAELELLNLKHNFPARPTFDCQSCLPKEKIDPIHVPEIEDIWIDLTHEIDIRRKDHSQLALEEIIHYGIAIVPKKFKETDQEIDQ